VDAARPFDFGPKVRAQGDGYAVVSCSMNSARGAVAILGMTGLC
jgi:hypothetical protein